MKGISKKRQPGYLRFKLHKWTYAGLERHYFSAVDIATAISYVKKRTKDWSNASLHPVLNNGAWGAAIWKKEN